MWCGKEFVEVLDSEVCSAKCSAVKKERNGARLRSGQFMVQTVCKRAFRSWTQKWPVCCSNAARQNSVVDLESEVFASCLIWLLRLCGRPCGKYGGNVCVTPCHAVVNGAYRLFMGPYGEIAKRQVSKTSVSNETSSKTEAFRTRPPKVGCARHPP